MGRRARALLLLSLGYGCSAPPAATPPDDVAPDVGPSPFVGDWCKPTLEAGKTATVLVGEGQSFYRDIPDETTLTWEKGPQGGHHVWIALRQRGLRRSGTILTVDLEDVEDPSRPVLVNHSRLIYDFDKAEGYDAVMGGWCTRTGLRMQLDNAGGVSLESLMNHHVRVTATLKDPDGATSTGVRTIIVGGLLD
jgi:hypothetical protein